VYGGPHNTTKMLPISNGFFVAKDLVKNQDFVDLINSADAILGPDTVPPSFPYGQPVDFWDQYITLQATIYSAIGYSLLLCFLVLCVGLFVLAKSKDAGVCKKLIAAVWGAALVTGVIAMVVFELYGFMVWSDIQISAIPAITIIMSTGVAVEYTCYIAVAFINAPGTRVERSKEALDTMFAPTVDGCATMLLGVVLLSASNFPFIVKYFFYVWLLLIWFGLYNGLCVLPVLFSLFGPPALNSRSAVSDQIVNKQ